jgi:signal transduction histidine kinase
MNSSRYLAEVSNAKDIHSRVPRSLFSCICLTIVLLSVLVLIGWAFGIPLFTVLYPDYESIKPNTAAAFILSASSLWLLAPPNNTGSRRVLGLSFAWLVSAIGSVTLFEYVAGLNLGIDTALFDVTPRNLADLYPARMSIEGAFNFVLIGLALAALDRAAIRGFVLAEQLTLIPFVISILALIGYLYSQQSLYKSGPYTALALPTSLLFVVLSSGIFVSRSDRGLMATLTSRSAGGVILRRMLPVAVGTPVLVGWLRLRGQELGFYDLGFGLALFAAFSTLLCTIFLWRLASSLNSADMQRTRSENRVRRLLWQAEEREQALRDKQAELVQAAKLASIGELATGIAHEVNNPLNNIGLFVNNALDSIRAGKPVEIIVPWLNIVLKQVDRAAAIIASVRSFGRTAASEFKLVNVNDAITNAMALISEDLKVRDVQVRMNLAVDPILMQGHQAQLEQVFLNLFINARDAMEDTVERVLTIEADVSSDTITIIVRDTGCGISEEALGRIFDPFFTTKAVGKGTGLGLSISYRIIKEHQGDIRVHSEPAGGTSFLVSLPTGLQHEASTVRSEHQNLLSPLSR